MNFGTTSLRRAVQVWSNRLRALLAGLPATADLAQDIARKFREAGALTAPNAQPYRARSKMEEAVFLELLERGVIREPRRGRYYLDVEAFARIPRPIFIG